jgi:hypothetical protein
MNKRILLYCTTLLCLLCTATYAQKSIAYTVAKNIFVRNDYKPGYLKDHKITDLNTYNANFGQATTMGPDGKPTQIDFSTQFAIAVIPPVTDIATTLAPVSLLQQKGKLIFTYSITTGSKQTYTMQPMLLIVADKKLSKLPVVLKKVKGK